MNPNERTLELDKILELLANEAANDLTREQARQIGRASCRERV